MCFDLDARPPIAPIAGGAIDGAELELTAADGTRLRAYAARADRPTGAGILVLPDVRGLHPYYEELALRFAEHGIDAVAIDYFGRTAGTQARGAGFDFMSHVDRTTWAGISADVRAGVEHLRSADGGATRTVFTVGFCLGGRLSFLTATLGLDLAGVIGFYGWPVGRSRNDSPAPADVAAEFKAPVLGVFGGADAGIPPEAVGAFETALERAGVEHRLISVPGAPHSFFDRRAEDYAAESAEAWEACLQFIGSRTPRG